MSTKRKRVKNVKVGGRYVMRVTGNKRSVVMVLSDHPKGGWNVKSEHTRKLHRVKTLEAVLYEWNGNGWPKETERDNVDRSGDQLLQGLWW